MSSSLLFPAVSYVSGLSNLDSFCDGRQVAVYRTCSILLSAFLCHCRLASSRAILLGS